MGEKFDTAFEGQRREVGDLKDRLTALEQQRVGGAAVEAKQNISGDKLLAGIAIAVSVLTIVVVVVLAAVA